jgi:hypothetical protein
MPVILALRRLRQKNPVEGQPGATLSQKKNAKQVRTLPFPP